MSLVNVNKTPCSLEGRLGTAMRVERRRQKVAQVELARRIGRDVDTIKRLERGVGTVAAFADAIAALGLRFRGQNQERIGDWLRSVRLQLGKTQGQIADATGLTRPTVIAVEKARGRVSSLLLIMAELGLRPELCPVDEVQGPRWEVHLGDAREFMSTIAPASIDGIVCDPPYNLGAVTPSKFMALLGAWQTGRSGPTIPSYMDDTDWDGQMPGPDVWMTAIEVLRPGGHLLAFAAPRNADLLGLSLRLAGFEVRGQLVWAFRGGLGGGPDAGRLMALRALRARMRAGDGPQEAIPRRRFPAPGGSATPIQGLALSDRELLALVPEAQDAVDAVAGAKPHLRSAHEVITIARRPLVEPMMDTVLQTGVGALFTRETRVRGRDGRRRHPTNLIDDLDALDLTHLDVPKPRRGERGRFVDGKNDHPTVKPLRLLRWLVRLVSQPGATILDPFVGSGTTGIAAVVEGRNFMGVERDEKFVAIARQRIEGWAREHQVETSSSREL
jgi:transcriptional regulator with XRE-family HTH domain